MAISLPVTSAPSFSSQPTPAIDNRRNITADPAGSIVRRPEAFVAVSAQNVPPTSLNGAALQAFLYGATEAFITLVDRSGNHWRMQIVREAITDNRSTPAGEITNGENDGEAMANEAENDEQTDGDRMDVHDPVNQ